MGRDVRQLGQKDVGFHNGLAGKTDLEVEIVFSSKDGHAGATNTSTTSAPPGDSIPGKLQSLQNGETLRHLVFFPHHIDGDHFDDVVHFRFSLSLFRVVDGGQSLLEAIVGKQHGRDLGISEYGSPQLFMVSSARDPWLTGQHGDPSFSPRRALPPFARKRKCRATSWIPTGCGRERLLRLHRPHKGSGHSFLRGH